MSQRQASRQAARVRWRRQAARLVADAYLSEPLRSRLPNRITDRKVIARACLDGAPFDVAEVRAYCERLVAEGERLAVEREQFIQWARTRGRNYHTADRSRAYKDWRLVVGMGPENTDAGAFVLDRWVYAHTTGLRDRLIADGWEVGDWVWVGEVRFWAMVERFRGGWPGPLAREYGWERCKACEGNGRLDPEPTAKARVRGQARRDAGGSECGACSGSSGRWDTESIDQWYPCEACDGTGAGRPRCTACKGRGRTRKHGVPPGFANGDSIARTARRLLDTLDGRCPWAPSAPAQTSECEGGCKRHEFPGSDIPPTWGVRSVDVPSSWLKCPSCRGTGHNLAGVLPRVEYPARWRPVVVAPAGEVPAPGEIGGRQLAGDAPKHLADRNACERVADSRPPFCRSELIRKPNQADHRRPLRWCDVRKLVGSRRRTRLGR